MQFKSLLCYLDLFMGISDRQVCTQCKQSSWQNIIIRVATFYGCKTRGTCSLEWFVPNSNFPLGSIKYCWIELNLPKNTSYSIFWRPPPIIYILSLFSFFFFFLYFSSIKKTSYVQFFISLSLSAFVHLSIGLAFYISVFLSSFLHLLSLPFCFLIFSPAKRIQASLGG